MNSRTQGQHFEEKALALLLNNKHTLVTQNFHARTGEIDLITLDTPQNCLVFTEVRYRNTTHFGGALASVDARKQQKIIQTAQQFLQSHPKWQKYDCRFDVVAFEGEQHDWVKNAFDASWVHLHHPLKRI